MDFIIFTSDDILRLKLLEIFKFILADRDIDFINLYKTYPKSVAELKKICDDNMPKIIFLDLSDEKLEEGSWIRRFGEVSKEYKNAGFVLLAGREINAGDIFKNYINVKYFINKVTDDITRKIEKFIMMLVKEYYDEGKYIMAFNSIGNTIKIFYKDIFFIETVKGKHKCIIYYKNGVGILRVGINELMRQLDSRFVLCRPSTIANKNNILEIDFKNNVFYFEKKLSCTFSRSNKKKIKDIMKRELIL